MGFLERGQFQRGRFIRERCSLERRFYKIEGGPIREECFLERWIYKIGGLFGVYLGVLEERGNFQTEFYQRRGGFLESGADQRGASYRRKIFTVGGLSEREVFIGKEDFQRGRGFRVLFSISESDLKNSLAHNSSYFFRELQVSITCERSFHMFWFLNNRAEYIVENSHH